ncbi:hypothetical protein HK405_009824, partial [Cladochytrium tenue]
PSIPRRGPGTLDFIRYRTLEEDIEEDEEDYDPARPLLQPHPSRLHPSNRPAFPAPESEPNLRDLLHQRIEEFRSERLASLPAISPPTAAAALPSSSRSFWSYLSCCCGGIDEETAMAEAQTQNHLTVPGTADARSTHSHTSRRSIAKGPIIDHAGLSIVERVFFKSAPSRPQVIMGIMLRLRLPDGVPTLKVARIVDLLRLGQARHFRLSAGIDPDTMVGSLLADNARDLPCSYRFVTRERVDTWKDVYEEEVNTNFDVQDSSKPLWRSVIILPEEHIPKDGPVFEG